MSILLLVLILSSLAFQVFPVSLGTSIRHDRTKSIAVVVSLIITQALMLWLGVFVGKHFLYLTAGYENIIVFIGFFLIGLRISIESFAVRKGERTFNSDNNQNIVLASVAQSINTFLAGLMFYFFNFDESLLIEILLISGFAFAFAGSLLKLSKMSLSLSSLLYLLSGIILLTSSIYLGFFSTINN